MANQALLLQTAALTSIHEPRRPQDTLGVQLILDNGSQHSYIPSQDALHLVPGQCNLAVAAFGSKRGKKQGCKVRIRVKIHDGDDPELTLQFRTFVSLYLYSPSPYVVRYTVTSRV